MERRLTGKWRHRSGWFGRLILQVQYEGITYSDGLYGPMYKAWRDANVSDLPWTMRDDSIENSKKGE